MNDTHSKRRAIGREHGARDDAADGSEAATSRIVAGRRDTALERFAQQAFAADVGRIDPATRTRLAAARRQALDALRTGRSPGASRRGPLRTAPTWAVAGLAAALVLALAAVLRTDDGALGVDGRLVDSANDAASIDPAGSAERTDDESIPLAGAAEPLLWPDDLELLAGGGPDVLDVLEEDLAFYAWLEEQPELAATEERRR